MNKVAQIIAAEIRDKGAISFARFMENALYCPNYGYYEKERDIIGRGGDYYTSVSAGSLFGELLAYQFAEWLQECQRAVGDGPAQGAPGTVQIVEGGAHNGDLAKDILSWLAAHRPALFGAIKYIIIEPSIRRRRLQKERLQDFAERLCWAESPRELAALAAKGLRASERETGVCGVIFGNELLDAMPVHRFGWDAGSRSWFEWGVTVDDGHFAWTRLADRDAAMARLRRGAVCNPFLQAVLCGEGGLSEHLPDGFTTEWCPGAEQWWRSAGLALRIGKLVAIDYGLSAEEFFTPERKAGTLRAYRSHRLSDDVLDSPGEQDLTAQVNFTAIQRAGESAGLQMDLLQSQAQFLTGIAAGYWSAESPSGERSMPRSRQFQTLTRPEFLGQVFQVLVQSRS